MPWTIPRLAGDSLRLAGLAVLMGVVVSCVTVAGEPAPSASLASGAGGPAASAIPSAVAPATATGSAHPSAALPSPVAGTGGDGGAALEPTAVGAGLAQAGLAATSQPVPSSPMAASPATEPSPLLTSPPALQPTPASSAAATASSIPESASSAGPAKDAGAEAGRARLDERTRARLDRILRTMVKEERVAGLQAAVRLPSGETWLGAAGMAEMSPGRPVDDDTQFAIASVTKTFVAALVLQLAEEGTLELDAPFGRYFDDAPRSRVVTVRQLLSHTSGIHNHWENPRYYRISRSWWAQPDASGLQARDHAWTYEEIMDLVKSGYFKPGEGYHYSNTNYVILRRVVEAVTGEPIHRLLRQRFLEPLGMEDTVYQPAERPRPDAAHGHWDTGSGYMDHTRDSAYIPFLAAVTVADGAGAMASSANDLVTWAAALYGGQVLSEASLEQMTTMLLPGSYGLGTDVAVFAGHRGYGHRGGVRGFEASMWYFPDSGVAIALVSDQGNWITDVPMKKLVRAVLGAG